MSLESEYTQLKKILPEFSDVFFAQEGEDALLRRLLKDKYACKGSYIDVGALHPLRFSNTAHYYMRGWNGINIEPNPDVIGLFERIRPRDVNISTAIGEHGESIYYRFKEPAFNTFDEEQLEFAQTKTELLNKITIKKIPLHEILSEHQKILNELIFFNIDVEGMELEVLKTNKWDIYRPLLVLVEALTKSKFIEIENYMNQQSYHFVARTKNTYFFAEKKFKVSYVDSAGISDEVLFEKRQNISFIQKAGNQLLGLVLYPFIDRKYVIKLEENPEAFFKDSKSGFTRTIGKLLRFIQ